jgi:hypothetical protein
MCQESVARSDFAPHETAQENGIVFKDSIKWRDAYSHLKTVLATREHISTSAERSRARKERGPSKSGRKSHQRMNRNGHSVYALR